MAYILVALFVIGAIALVIYMKRRDKQPQFINNQLTNLGINVKKYAQFKKDFVTPNGTLVKATVADVPANFLAIADASIQRVIRNHTRKYPTWNNFKDPKQWGILLVDPMATNQETEPGSPALIVGGYQTAGTVIGQHPASPLDRPWLVIPHQSDRGWAYLSYFANSVYAEGEHAFESQNDFNGVYQWYTGENDAHPHAGDE